MTWIDRIIETISPRAAYMREGWRQQLGLIRGSGYDAADGGRLNKNWRGRRHHRPLQPGHPPRPRPRP